MNKLESKFQNEIKTEIKKIFPESIITKLDSSMIQGIPDLLILKDNKWATLENKRSEKAPYRPNQKYYIDKMDKMSFSSVIYPEIKEIVLNKLFNFLSDGKISYKK